MSLVPGDDLAAPGWSLELVVDLPATSAQDARVVVHLTDGTTSLHPLEQSVDGTHTATVPFTAGEVEDVELVLVNASRQVRSCWTDGFGDTYACRGVPLNDGLRTTYRATVVQD